MLLNLGIHVGIMCIVSLVQIMYMYINLLTTLLQVSSQFPHCPQ